MGRALPMSLWVLVSLSACPADEAPLDVRGVDAPRTDRGPVKDGPVDHASSADRRLTEAWQPDDLGFSCSGCLLEQVCVHSVNATTCQVIKSQCKYRTPNCFSPATNPCCDCEAEVCGLHSLPLSLVAFRLARWGYRTVVLGAMTPPEALATAVRSLEPDLVALSVTIPVARERGMDLARRYADAIGTVPWIVGGTGADGMREAIDQGGGVVANQETEQLRQQVKQALTMARVRRGQLRREDA